MAADAPFWDYTSFIDHLAFNAINDGDNLVVIDGDERSGKSALAWRITQDLSKRLGELSKKKHDFDADRDVILDWDDWTAAWDWHRLNAIYLFDEGGNLAFSRDYSKAENKGLVKVLMQAGQLNTTMLFIIPNFNFLDRYLREHRTQIRIHVERRGYKRGFATVQVVKKSWRMGTVWMEDVFDLRYADVDKDDQWERYQSKKRRALERTSDSTTTATKKGKK